MITFEDVKQHWARLAQIAAWLAGLVGTFLIEPPHLQPGSGNAGIWLHFSQFLVAIMAGLFFLQPAPTGGPREKWRIVAIVAAVVSVALFVAYQLLPPSWTCVYRGETVMIGHTLSDLGRQFLATHQGSGCSRMIGAALGVTTDLWPKEELLIRYIAISAIYSLAILSFSAAAMATIEYVRRAPAGGEARK